MTLPFPARGVSGRPRPVPTPILRPTLSGPPDPVTRFGVVSHLAEGVDVARIHELNVNDVRVTWYLEIDTDNAIIDGMLATLAIAFVHPLVVVNGNMKTLGAPEVARRLIVQARGRPSTVFQIGNEVDANEYADDAAAAGVFMASVRVIVIEAVPDAQLIPGGISNSGGREWIRAALAHGYARPSDPLPIHCYGGQDTVDLDLAVQNRMNDLAAAGWAGAVWITEFGSRAANAGTQSDDIAAGVEKIKALGLARAYVYALYSPDDGYGLTVGPTREPRAAFARYVVP